MSVTTRMPPVNYPLHVGFDLVGLVEEISRLLSADMPAFDPAVLLAAEDIAAAAKEVGTDPATALEHLRVLADQHDTLSEVLGRARTHVAQAAADGVRIAIQALGQAAPLVPLALSPDPAVGTAAKARLVMIGQQALQAAAHRARTLMEQLRPLAARLSRVAAEPHPLPKAPVDVNALVPISGPPPPPAAASSSPGAGSSAGSAAVRAALSQLGTPYHWGGTTPGVGFDCSGLTQWAWRQAGVEIPRLAQHQTTGRKVSFSELAEGDLLVWDGHVAMYIGNGQIVEAGSPVQTSPLRTTNMGMAFRGYFRPTG